jgi:type IV pilus assembly protein PilO
MALGMPKTQREQLMVLIGFLGLAAAGIYWSYVYSPQTADMAKESLALDTLMNRNALADSVLATGTVSDLRTQAKSYGENLDLVRQLVPGADEVPALVDQISTSARRAGLDVSTFEPLGPEQSRDFDALRYKLQIKGGYHDIAEFLTNVASMSRIVVPVNVKINAASNAGVGSNRPVEAVFELHTYVAHTSAPPAKGGE